jgi:hypothetical protein
VNWVCGICVHHDSRSGFACGLCRKPAQANYNVYTGRKNVMLDISVALSMMLGLSGVQLSFRSNRANNVGHTAYCRLSQEHFYFRMARVADYAALLPSHWYIASKQHNISNRPESWYLMRCFFGRALAV